MRISFLFAAGLLLAGTALTATPASADRRAPAAAPSVQAPQVDEISAARRKRVRAYRAYGGNQIACTRFGCRPIPRNCRITTEYNFWTMDPSGFDAVVCR